jgi:hypothetical protein
LGDIVPDAGQQVAPHDIVPDVGQQASLSIPVSTPTACNSQVKLHRMPAKIWWPKTLLVLQSPLIRSCLFNLVLS